MGGFEGEELLGAAGIFSKGAEDIARDINIDFVAHFEAGHFAAHSSDDAGEIAAGDREFGFEKTK